MDRRPPAGARLRHLVVLGLPLLAGMLVASIAEDAWGHPAAARATAAAAAAAAAAARPGSSTCCSSRSSTPHRGDPAGGDRPLRGLHETENTLSNWDGGGEPQSLHQVAAQIIQPRPAGAEARDMSTLRAIDPDFSGLSSGTSSTGRTPACIWPEETTRRPPRSGRTSLRGEDRARGPRSRWSAGDQRHRRHESPERPSADLGDPDPRGHSSFGSSPTSPWRSLAAAGAACTAWRSGR